MGPMLRCRRLYGDEAGASTCLGLSACQRNEGVTERATHRLAPKQRDEPQQPHQHHLNDYTQRNGRHSCHQYRVVNQWSVT